MKKPVVIIILFFLPFINLFSQQGRDLAKEKYLEKSEGLIHPNAIKVNSLAIAFNNISVSYERALSSRFSTGVNFGYKYSGSDQGFLNIDNAKFDIYTKPITGFTITPEVRWYARKCDDRLLEGFYISMYLRFTRYNTGLNFDYYPEENDPRFLQADVGIGEYGIGLQLGYQLVLWKRLNIDFMFFGPRYSSYHLLYEFDQNVSAQFLEDLTDFVNDAIDRFGLEYKVEVKQSGEKRASHTFSFANIRFGIGLGFSF